jgi:hypothetical protein
MLEHIWKHPEIVGFHEYLFRIFRDHEDHHLHMSHVSQSTRHRMAPHGTAARLPSLNQGW